MENCRNQQFLSCKLYAILSRNLTLFCFVQPMAQSSFVLYIVPIKSLTSFQFGEGNGNPLQYSCLENPMDRGAWRAAVYGVAQSQTRLRRLSTHAFIGEGNGNPLQYSCLENPMDRGAWWAAVCGVAQSQTWLKWLSSSSSFWLSGRLSQYCIVCVQVSFMLVTNDPEAQN